MKLAIAAVLLVVAAMASATTSIPSARNYHETIGIPKAAKLKQQETELMQSSRIVGGAETEISQVPYQVGLLIELFYFLTSMCGGNLISNTRIVTAAHCVYNPSLPVTGATAVLGSDYLFFGGTRVNVISWTVHPDFDYDLIRHDIAFMDISPVTYTDNIQPIALPTGALSSELFVGESGLASGYGLTSDGGSTANPRLFSVELPIIDNINCLVVYGPLSVLSSNVCASAAGGKSTCSGDSGGPLAVERDGQKILVGVVSYGHIEGCAFDHPVAFARTSSYLDFINSN